MTDIFASIFPTSYLVLLFGLIIGLCISFTVFSTLSLIVVFIFMYMGVIRLRPFLELFDTCFYKLFPHEYKSLISNVKASFPVRVVDTLPHKGIYLIHPHGLLTMAHIMHVGTRLTNWPERNIKGTAMYSLWYILGMSECLDEFIPSYYESMKAVLHSNKSLSISLGGIAEVQQVTPGRMCLKVKSRKGAFKLAIETGTPIVPVLVYGENELYQPIIQGELLKNVNSFLNKFGMTMLFPSFESLYKTLQLIYKPYNNPIETCIGKAIPVGPAREATKESIYLIRKIYMKRLQELYTETKPAHYADKIEFI